MLKMSAICVYTISQTVPEIRDRHADCVSGKSFQIFIGADFSYENSVLRLRIQVRQFLKQCDSKQNRMT